MNNSQSKGTVAVSRPTASSTDAAPPETPAGPGQAEIEYHYTKTRKEFGRQERSLQDHFRIHANVKPLQKYRKLVTKQSMVDKDMQTATYMSVDEMNTMRAQFVEFSMLHEEGGWPKDVNVIDTEMVQRYRKKLEKEESFISAVRSMTDEMEEHIKNNNTINFYRNNYTCDDLLPQDRDVVPSATVVTMYKNPGTLPTRVSRISFAPENIGRMAVAQCPYEFDPSLREHRGEAYFWEIENPTRPEAMIRAGSLILDVRYHPKDVHCIIGSLFTGQVAVWDARVSPDPQLVSNFDISHSDVCTTAMWINSKSGNEFFSAGMDGQVIWWDERNLNEQLDSLFTDPEKGQMRPEAAEGTTVLEYDHSLPTKFLAGTVRGNIMVFMKKGKSPTERMIHLYKAHKGPIMACHRNPMFIKTFLTVGEYTVRIFAEDCKESSIMWTAPTDIRYSDANWLIGRPSCFMACRNDGILEFWDVLVRGASSILSLQVCDEALTACCAADTGKHVAAGSLHGDVRFIQLSESLADFDKAEKPNLGLVFDRESRREKYLEQRNREIRLKKRDQEKQEAIQQKQLEEDKAERLAYGYPENVDDLDNHQIEAIKLRIEMAKNPVIQAEKEFFDALDEEIKTKGIDAWPDKKVAKGGEEEEEEGGEASMMNIPDAGFDDTLEGGEEKDKKDEAAVSVPLEGVTEEVNEEGENEEEEEEEEGEVNEVENVEDEEDVEVTQNKEEEEEEDKPEEADEEEPEDEPEEDRPAAEEAASAPAEDEVEDEDEE